MATDHAPHTMEEKHAAFAKYQEEFPGLDKVQIAKRVAKENPELFRETCCNNGMSGAPWLDTYASVATWLMKEEGFSTQDIARVAAYNPGRFVNQFLGTQFPGVEYGKGFGRIAPGYVGSLTIINTDRPQQ